MGDQKGKRGSADRSPSDFICLYDSIYMTQVQKDSVAASFLRAFSSLPDTLIFTSLAACIFIVIVQLFVTVHSALPLAAGRGHVQVNYNHLIPPRLLLPPQPATGQAALFEASKTLQDRQGSGRNISAGQISDPTDRRSCAYRLRIQREESRDCTLRLWSLKIALLIIDIAEEANRDLYNTI